MTTTAVALAQPVFVGQRIIVEGRFRLAGVPRDPVLVQFLIRSPSGSVVTLGYPSDDVVRHDEGLYDAYVIVDEAGTWYFRWQGQGTVDAVDEIAVNVYPTQF